MALGLLVAAGIFGITALLMTILFPKVIYNEAARNAIGAGFLTGVVLLIAGLICLAVQLL